MPRQKTPAGRTVDAAGTELRAIRLDLSPEMHRKLRIEAACHDKSMAALAREVIEQYLNDEK